MSTSLSHNHPRMILLSTPTAEPLSLVEVKRYLRIETADDDALLNSLIIAARGYAENFLHRSLITQSWIAAFDDYIPSIVSLPKGPIQSITNVTMIARNGTETIVSSDSYYLSAGKHRLIFDATPFSHQVEITYVTGYGDAASDVPESVRQGMLAHVAVCYDFRTGNAALPAMSRELYHPYKLFRI